MNKCAGILVPLFEQGGYCKKFSGHYLIYSIITVGVPLRVRLYAHTPSGINHSRPTTHRAAGIPACRQAGAPILNAELPFPKSIIQSSIIKQQGGNCKKFFEL
ncbi:hypothetical protein BEL04_01085 [Mucilaginibacter sp. PPCGB 2223]|nr:hypothetical protein BEL04_01085 [Mucilaginibacter sp. PPCGB 2223]